MMEKEQINWLKDCLLPCFKEFKDLAGKVTAKKAY